MARRTLREISERFGFHDQLIPYRDQGLAAVGLLQKQIELLSGNLKSTQEHCRSLQARVKNLETIVVLQMVSLDNLARTVNYNVAARNSTTRTMERTLGDLLYAGEGARPSIVLGSATPEIAARKCMHTA